MVEVKLTDNEVVAVLIVAGFVLSCAVAAVTGYASVALACYFLYCITVIFATQSWWNAKFDGMVEEWATSNCYTVLDLRPADSRERRRVTGAHSDARAIYRVTIKDLRGGRWEGWLLCGGYLLGASVNKVQEIGFEEVPEEKQLEKPSQGQTQSGERLWDRELDE